MKLYIDADAFPNLLKPLVLKAIERRNIETIVVSNKKVSIGKSENISYVIVDVKLDEADNYISNLVQKGDLVITADIPLANNVVEKNGFAIDFRGELYDANNIKQYLTMRNLMDEIRSTGEITKGPRPFDKKNVHNFSNSFNKFLDKFHK
jgi:uncharacterized protein YaiI (UPF0178 family)